MNRISSLQDFLNTQKRDNPEQTFPLEIFSEGAQSEKEFLEWLLLTYDYSARRQQIRNWPNSTVFLGKVNNYPKNYNVFALGENAARGIENLTSTVVRRIRLPKWFARRFGGPTEIRWVKLKNGNSHRVIVSNPKRPRDWMSTFLFGSGGKMGLHFWKILYLMGQKTSDSPQILKVVREVPKLPVVMTSRMAQNSWWTQDRSLIPVPRRSKNETRYHARSSRETHIPTA